MPTCWSGFTTTRHARDPTNRVTSGTPAARDDQLEPDRMGGKPTTSFVQTEAWVHECKTRRDYATVSLRGGRNAPGPRQNLGPTDPSSDAPVTAASREPSTPTAVLVLRRARGQIHPCQCKGVYASGWRSYQRFTRRLMPSPCSVGRMFRPGCMPGSSAHQPCICRRRRSLRRRPIGSIF